jgi:hypothetical protein
MSWTMVGALGEHFGASAVVASLLYVGHQVRQSNRIARTEAYRAVTLSWARMLHQCADDLDLHLLDPRPFARAGGGVQISLLDAGSPFNSEERSRQYPG